MELLALAAFAGVWLLVAMWGKKQGWRGLTRHLGGAALGLAVFALIAPASSVDDKSKGDIAAPLAAPFADLREAYPGITETEVIDQVDGKPKLVITYNSPSVWSAGNWINTISFAQEGMLKRVAEAHGTEFSGVEIIYQVPMTDQHGNNLQDTGLRMEYQMADLQKVQWDNATAFLLLDLASPQFMPAGRDGQSEYCVKNAEFAPVFCGH